MNNIKTFYSSNNLTIYVGLNCKANDYLTFKVAKPNDIWFHISDYPGSHVVLNSNNNVAYNDILHAAQLAAKHSKAPKGHVVIDYCRVYDVSKPKKASYGEVEIVNSKKIRMYLS